MTDILFISQTPEPLKGSKSARDECKQTFYLDAFEAVICQFLMVLFLPKFMINMMTLILKSSISHF